MLAAFRPDAVYVDGEQRDDVIVAVSPTPLGGDGFDRSYERRMNVDIISIIKSWLERHLLPEKGLFYIGGSDTRHLRLTRPTRKRQ